MTVDAHRSAEPLRSIGLFLLLTVCLSGIFWALINATHTPYTYYVWLLMWTARASVLVVMSDT